MATEQQVINKLKRGRETAPHATKRKAVTFPAVQVLEDGTTVTDVRDRQRTGYIYVKYDNNVPQSATDDARSGVSVRCVGRVANYKPDVPVWVERDADGEDHVIGLDEAQAIDAYEDAASTMTMPELPGGYPRDIVSGWRFKPLRVRIADEGGLSVMIEEGIYEYADQSFAWIDNTPVDLSSISVSSGMKRPVIIGLDPATETAITAYGDETPVIMPLFTLVDYNVVRNANPGKIWLFGYEHKDGKTAFTDIYDLKDIRAYLSPGQGVSSGGSFMPIELDFALTIPANRQVPVRRLTVTTSGVLTVDGILDVF